MSMLHYPIYSLIILHIHLRHQTLQLLSLHIRDLIDTIGSIIAICYWLKLNFEKLILSYVTILSTNYLMRIKVRWISQRMILCCMISMLFPQKNLKSLLLSGTTSYFGLYSLVYLQISFSLPIILISTELIKMPQKQDLMQSHQCECI